MYRLSRFFISDVVAGENIIQNGCFPICRRGERADHGVLFAQNGSCKTTLLSFLLNVFNPEKRRFVQYLQSGGDKTLEQYLIPGRPAVVMLELVTTLEPTLFEAEPEERLVVGQLLVRDKHDPGKVDRLYFNTEDEAFFDLLKETWASLLKENDARRVIREFLLERVESTHTQSEWERSLIRLGLDPWLMDHQIDFARTEGGIKDAFKFKTEEEFMGFFLGCVTDMDEASELRRTVKDNIKKMANRPEKKAQRNSIWALRERIASFDALGQAWRNAKARVEDTHRKLGEAHSLLGRSKKAHARKETEARATLAATHEEKQRVEKAKGEVKANILWVEARLIEDEIEGQKKCVEENAALLEKSKAELAALKAAGFMAERRRLDAEIKDGEKVLATKGGELAPLRRQVGVRAGQYHLRLKEEQRLWESRIATLEEEKRVLISAQVNGQTEMRRLEKSIERVQAEVTRHATMIDAGEKALKALALLDGEAPSEARDRLKRELGEMAIRKEAISGQFQEIKGALHSLEEDFRKHQRLLVEGEHACKAAERQVIEETSVRQKLHEDRNLATLAGRRDFDPTSADLEGLIQEAVARQQEKVRAIELALMGLEAEHDRLESMGTLAVDEETRRLLEYYREQGLGRAEIQTFPEYLTELYDDPEDIAAYLNKDPGRFTGMMAASSEVIEKVMGLGAPQWLCRPVVISTPCEAEDVQEISFRVIAPSDASVYSSDHLAERLKQVKHEMEERAQEKVDAKTRLGALEETFSSIKGYRKLYPDRLRVERLLRKEQESRENLEGLRKQGVALEEKKKAFEARREPLEKELATLGEAAGRTEGEIKQLQGWLDQYGELAAWRRVHGEKREAACKLAAELSEVQKGLEDLAEEVQLLLETLATKGAELKALKRKGGDIPLPEGEVLSDKEREEALGYDLESLGTLYQEACDLERQVAGELGIVLLAETLERQRSERHRAVQALDRLKEEAPFEASLALSHSRMGKEERDQRSAEFLAVKEDAMEKKGRLSAKLEEGRRKLDNHNERLKLLIKRGIAPSFTKETVENGDARALLEACHLETSQLEETERQLEKRIPQLEARLGGLRAWAKDLDVGLAQVKRYEPVWDDVSPRLGWPDLEHFEGEVAPTDLFLKMVDESVGGAVAAETDVARDRQRMGSAFDLLQTELRDETLQKRLPTIVDELRRHDAETLGSQSGEFIERCSQLAENIESDLARSEQFVKSLVDSLLQHAKECHQRLQAATRITIGKEVFIYGGNAILKCGTKLEFTRHNDAFRDSLDNWFHELVEKGTLPEVNPKAGNLLGTELLYRLLRAATGRAHFGIRLLKCDDSGRNYEQVGKDLGSGGEALTTAVLLYSLLTSMRQGRRHKKEDRIPAFLIADNPLGVCNRSDFLDAQLKVARAMGIQCVYFTGINDTESLGLFEHRVAIRKSDRRLRIDGKDYTALEVIEQHVEPQDEERGGSYGAA
ncbi:MAG: hypothetical protein MI742_04255 [Desulfobacterales bacterium]|nr:hypothetical protein [Desulfobacterales bacterium]